MIRTHRLGIYYVYVFSAVCSLLPAGTLHADDYRKFTSTDGKTIEARILDYDRNDGVDIELRDGTTFHNVPVSRFLSQDRAYMRDWKHRREEQTNSAASLMPDSKIVMTLKRSKDNDLNDKGDPDNREVDYEPGITFVNKEKNLSFRNLRGTLVIIGQSVLKSREYHILHREEFTVDYLPARGRTKWQGTPFTNVYDDYPRNGSAFGADYEGYLIVLRDRKGYDRIIKASKTKWKDVYKAILDADPGKGHSNDFSKSFRKTRV